MISAKIVKNMNDKNNIKINNREKNNNSIAFILLFLTKYMQ
jgi:hypothetical protein